MGGALNQGKERKAKKYDICVIRTDKRCDDSVNLVNARPCQHCLEMMKNVGIRRVYYSNDTGEIVSETVRDMFSLHTSNVMMKYDLNSRKTSNKDFVNDKTINVIKYYDSVLKKKLPDTLKKENFEHWFNYDLKNMVLSYTIVKCKECGCYYDVINPHNQVVKRFMVV